MMKTVLEIKCENFYMKYQLKICKTIIFIPMHCEVTKANLF